MARKTNISFVDDLTGEEAAETVSFGIDSHAYEIDLTTEHAAELRELLSRYIQAARQTTKRRSAPRPQTTPDYDPAAVRNWARTQGFQLADRGRIPAAVLVQYRANAISDNA